MIAIIFKFSEDKSSNRYAINTFNYLNAFIISLILVGKTSLFNINWFYTLNDEIGTVLIHGKQFSPLSSQAWAVIIGSISGVFYYLGFFLYQYNFL